ncbi:MAG: hypothetical protein ROO76_06450 [Terriglobia bacterium]|nr:hypothetical protein [Terriglobia bacterium]
MNRISLTILVFALCSSALAKHHHFYQKGQLLSMESVSCGYAEKSGNTFKGEILGTNGGHKNTEEVLCQEYVLKSDQVIYRIRPRDEKHPVLLPVGQTAEFRTDKDKLLLKVDELDGKERAYTVVSMKPVDDLSAEKK